MVDAAGVRKQAKEAHAQAQQQAAAAAAAAAEGGDKSPAASGAKAASDLFYKGWVSYVEAPSHAAALLQQLHHLLNASKAKTIPKTRLVLLLARVTGSAEPTVVAVAAPCYPVVSMGGGVSGNYVVMFAIIRGHLLLTMPRMHYRPCLDKS
jgi:hypothetical protein